MKSMLPNPLVRAAREVWDEIARAYKDNAGYAFAYAKLREALVDAVDRTERRCIKETCTWCDRGHWPQRRSWGWCHPAGLYDGRENVVCQSGRIWETRYRLGEQTDGE